MRNTLNSTIVIQNARKAVWEDILTNQESVLSSLGKVSASFPHATWTSIYVANLMYDRSRYLDDVIHEWRRGKISESLGYLLNSTSLINLLPAATTAKSCTIHSGNMVMLKFWTKNVDKNSFVVTADPFKIYTNLTRQPTLREYSGPIHLIYNRSSDCTKSIEIDNGMFISASCTEQHRHEDLRSLWKPLVTHETITHIVPTNEAKVGFRSMHIYCYPGNITVGGEIVNCPPYVFKIDNTISWNLTDRNYVATPESIKLQAILGFRSFIPVPSTKIAPEGLTIFDALKRIQEMQEVLSKLDKKSLDLTDHTKQIVALSKHNTTLDVISLMCGCIILLLLMKCFYKRGVFQQARDRSQHLGLNTIVVAPANNAVSQI